MVAVQSAGALIFLLTILFFTIIFAPTKWKQVAYWLVAVWWKESVEQIGHCPVTQSSWINNVAIVLMPQISVLSFAILKTLLISMVISLNHSMFGFKV